MRVGRHDIKLTNLDKPMFPADGITKKEVIDYYAAVADHMLPLVRDRLMTLERFPNGLEGERFFSKGIPKYFPDFVERTTAPKRGGEVTYVVCNNAATVVYLAQQACLTSHVGLSRRDAIEFPDQLIFDLDPAGDDVPGVLWAARIVRALLEDLGLVCYVKSSGSKGLHIVTPTDRKTHFDDAREFASKVATLLADRHPDRLTTEVPKEKRHGRLLLDWMRNSWGATAVSPYSLRARPGAPVALPLAWEETEEKGWHPRLFTIADTPKKIERDGDPWAGWRRRARSLTGPRRRLEKLLEGSE